VRTERLAVNPDQVKAQMEGGLVYALTAALYAEITLDRGRVAVALWGLPAGFDLGPSGFRYVHGRWCQFDPKGLLSSVLVDPA
jgi:hypothetical protein